MLTVERYLPSCQYSTCQNEFRDTKQTDNILSAEPSPWLWRNSLLRCIKQGIVSACTAKRSGHFRHFRNCFLISFGKYDVRTELRDFSIILYVIMCVYIHTYTWVHRTQWTVSSSGNRLSPITSAVAAALVYGRLCDSRLAGESQRLCVYAGCVRHSVRGCNSLWVTYLIVFLRGH